MKWWDFIPKDISNIEFCHVESAFERYSLATNIATYTSHFNIDKDHFDAFAKAAKTLGFVGNNSLDLNAQSTFPYQYWNTNTFYKFHKTHTFISVTAYNDYDTGVLNYYDASAISLNNHSVKALYDKFQKTVTMLKALE